MKNEVIVLNGTEVEFKVESDKAYISSLEVAKNFGKRHADLLNIIKREVMEQDFAERKISLSEYKDKSGKANKYYLLDRDIFSLVVMGMTGEKARKWKRAYIEAFNKMEQIIKEQQKQLLPNFNNPAEAARAWADEYEKRMALEQKVERDKPLVKFAETVQEQAEDLKIGDWIKALNNNGKLKMGRNKAFEWLRNNGYLMSNNTPYQKYIDNGYFNVKEVMFDKGDKKSVGLTTMITGKGQIKISDKLLKEKLLKK